MNLYIFFFNEVFQNDAWYSTISITKISKVHDDYKVLANGNLILHLMFSFARRSNLQFVIIIAVTAYLNYSSYWYCCPLQKCWHELRWRTQNTACVIFFYDVFIIIKHGLLDAYHNVVIILTEQKCSVLFLQSIVSIVKFEFQSQSPFQLALESINSFVYFEYFSRTQDYFVISLKLSVSNFVSQEAMYFS